MSESSTGEPPTDEKEGWREAPEQSERPRIRSAAGRTTLPADADLERLVHDSSPEILTAVAADPRLAEDLALALLNHRDLPREALEALISLGFNSVEAREKIDAVATGKTKFKTAEDVILAIYQQEKG